MGAVEKLVLLHRPRSTIASALKVQLWNILPSSDRTKERETQALLLARQSALARAAAQRGRFHKVTKAALANTLALEDREIRVARYKKT